MKYRNAKDAIPPELLRELRVYVSGEMLYVPKDDRVKTAWGEKNGTRKFFEERNREIRFSYQNGEGIEVLAERFGLSEDSIRKIVYGS